MKNSTFTALRSISFLAVFGIVSFLWLVLGGTVTSRSVLVSQKLAQQVEGNWGPQLEHRHPWALARATRTGEAMGMLLPESSSVQVKLHFQPQKKGLITHRTYRVAFQATYEWVNPEPVEQTVEVSFMVPSNVTRVDGFKLVLGDKVSDEAPSDGTAMLSTRLPPNGRATMTVEYTALGKDAWRYRFGEGGRTRNFELTMETNFRAYNIPVDAESATSQRDGAEGITHVWNFPSVTGVNAIGLEVPAFVNAAKVAARMSFFGPLSLGLFFGVLIIAALRMGVRLHLVHFVLLAAACFAFQLLFAYSVDVMPVELAFVLAAAASMTLVGGYLKLIAGLAYMRVALLAQFAYIVVFNATFFLDGYTGLTLTVMGIITLGLIMTGTAQIDWSRVIPGHLSGEEGKLPPPLPVK
jgi:hypothetical protein